MTIEGPKIFGVGFLGSYLISFSLMHICSAYSPKFEVIPQILFGLSCLLAATCGALLINQSLSSLALFARVLVIIFAVGTGSIILFYLPYFLPYSGREVEYQKLSGTALGLYIYGLRFGFLAVGLALIIFAMWRWTKLDGNS